MNVKCKEKDISIFKGFTHTKSKYCGLLLLVPLVIPIGKTSFWLYYSCKSFETLFRQLFTSIFCPLFLAKYLKLSQIRWKRLWASTVKSYHRSQMVWALLKLDQAAVLTSPFSLTLYFKVAESMMLLLPPCFYLFFSWQRRVQGSSLLHMFVMSPT